MRNGSNLSNHLRFERGSHMRPASRWFFRQIRPLLLNHMVSVALVVLSGLMFLLDPLLIKWLIDSVLPTKNFRLVALAGTGFLAIYVLRLAFSSAAIIVNFRAIQSIILRIRLSLLEQ